MFDFIKREIDNINIVLKYLLLEATGKKLNKEKVLFNYFNKFWIEDFGNTWHQGYGKT